MAYIPIAKARGFTPNFGNETIPTANTKKEAIPFSNASQAIMEIKKVTAKNQNQAKSASKKSIKPLTQSL